jgi:hypothetical protein
MKPFFLSAAICLMSSSAFATLASDVEALTGGHTRVVWVEHMTGASSDWDAVSGDFSIMGFDTRTGAITTIVPGPAGVHNPQFTPDGNQVVYTDIVNSRKAWIVNFDGTGKRELVNAYVYKVWRDPGTQKVWLYLGDCYMHSDRSTQPNASSLAYGLKRAPLDDPSKIEVVFANKSIDWRFSLSRDGLYAAVGNPWPYIGIMDMKTGNVTRIFEGCNQQIAPDDSYRMYGMDGGHHDYFNLGIKGAGPVERWSVEFASPTWSTMPPTSKTGEQAWAPRLSYNNAEIMTANSGISVGDIYIAKFNADISGITKKIRITTPNGKQKTSALAWISEGPASSSSSKKN